MNHNPHFYYYLSNYSVKNGESAVV